MSLLCAVAINGEMQYVITAEVRLRSALKALPVVIPCEVRQRSSFFVKLESSAAGQAISPAAEVTYPTEALVPAVKVTQHWHAGDATTSVSHPQCFFVSFCNRPCLDSYGQTYIPRNADMIPRRCPALCTVRRMRIDTDYSKSSAPHKNTLG